MEAGVVLQILIGLSMIALAFGDWADPPFGAPPQDDNVKFEYNQEQASAIIDLKEEVPSAVLAYILYDSETPVPITLPGETSLKETYTYNSDLKVWELRATQKIDYDTLESPSIRFSVGIGSETRRVVVRITNINDNIPRFTNPSRTCSIEENSEDTSGCSIILHDDDGGVDQNIVTVMEGSEESKFIQLSKQSCTNNCKDVEYSFTLTKQLDFESAAMHSLTVIAKDFDDESKTVNMIYIVEVVDKPDMIPRWVDIFSSLQVDEKQSTGYNISAIDGDIQIDAPISYRLEVEDSNYAKYFHLDESTGIFSVEPIDRDVEMKEFFKMTLVAYEKDDPKSEVPQNVVIIVNDVNDHSPQFEPSEDVSTSILEETPGTVDLNGIVKVIDPDLVEAGQFNIKLVDSEYSSAFLVVPNYGYQSGVISLSVADPNLLDYENETWRSFDLIIEAVEVFENSHTGQLKIHIDLEDRNDETPEFEDTLYDVTLPENTVKDTLVIAVKATDKDANDQITYNIIPSGSLRIDSATGEVFINDNSALDYERQSKIELQISAQDLESHRAYANLIINVEDINDEAPSLTLSMTQINIEELTTNTADLVTFVAEDMDSKPDLDVTIDWDATTGLRRGVKLTTDEEKAAYLNCVMLEQKKETDQKTTGSLKLNSDVILDWFQVDTINLALVVTDKNTAETFRDKSSVVFVMNIIDINNNKPEFQAPDVDNFTVLEETPNQLIGAVVATDNDGPGNNDIFYGIKVNTDGADEFLRIDERKGQIWSNAPIDRETFDYLDAVVIASDGLNNNTYNLIVYIEDQNDETPEFEPHDEQFLIPENSQTGTFVATIKATDADRTAPFNSLTYLMGPNTDSGLYFSVDQDTGDITVDLKNNNVLDRETTPTFDVPLIVRDNFQDGLQSNSRQATTSFKVVLVDENDCTPTFSPSTGCAATVPETVSTETDVLKVSASDCDDPATNNTLLTYDILSITRDEPIPLPNCDDIFDISDDDHEATIHPTRNLTGCWGEYDVLLSVIDHGEPQLTSNSTFRVCVIDVNDNPPTWVYPSDKMNIRIRERQIEGERLISDVEDNVPDFSANDPDDGPNGQITYELSGPDANMFEVKLLPESNSGYLTLVDEIQNDTTAFNLDITALDKGVNVLSSTISVRVVVVYKDNVDPTFNGSSDCMLQFTEGKTTGEEYQEVPEAFDLNNINDPEYIQEIFYFIVGGDRSLFLLNATSRMMTVTKPLDHEESPARNVYVVATNRADPPNIDITQPSNSLIQCNVTVIDVNDSPPEFTNTTLVEGFAVDDEIGTLIIKIEATDPDEDDEVTFKFGEVTASTTDLNEIANQAFTLKSDGSVLLAFQPPDKNANGFFTFKITAMDKMGDITGHTAEADAKIFIISEANRVVFQFYNPLEYVNEKQEEIKEVFSSEFQYICGIDNVMASLNSEGVVIANSTEVTTHFIDGDKELPIDKSLISQKFYEQTTLKNLQTKFWENYQLDLANYRDGSSAAAQNMEGVLQITLIVVSVVLGTMVIVLFVAFFLRTRSLSRRLKALSTTKFGSTESGLNRIASSVPNTNKHAIEGSNPVFGESEGQDFDAVSQTSGDSALVGIEDKAMFQNGLIRKDSFAKAGFEPSNNQQPVTQL